MQHVLRQFLLKFSAAMLLAVSSLSHAAYTAYTSRSSFEGALTSFSVDGLNGIPMGGRASDARPDFNISTTNYYFACYLIEQCHDNSAIGFDDEPYLTIYSSSPVKFTFTTAINGFGFDFGNMRYSDMASTPSIDGINNPATSGFFGVIYDTAVTSFVLTSSSRYMLADNITYGSVNVSPVPEPSSLVMLGIGLAGLGAMRRMQKAS